MHRFASLRRQGSEPTSAEATAQSSRTYGRVPNTPLAHVEAVGIEQGVCAQSSSHRSDGTSLSDTTSPLPGSVVLASPRITAESLSRLIGVRMAGRRRLCNRRAWGDIAFGASDGAQIANTARNAAKASIGSTASPAEPVRQRRAMLATTNARESRRMASATEGSFANGHRSKVSGAIFDVTLSSANSGALASWRRKITGHRG